jgi:adenosylcobinamide kinase/adenosylcobinamide-phosphate guanylyltransferase
MNCGRKIVFVLGGARSGKSSFALEKASSHQGRKAFIATAQALDAGMEERIAKHKKERGGDWTTLEEPMNIAPLIGKAVEEYAAVLVDCLTLWLSNLMLDGRNVEQEVEVFVSSLEACGKEIYLVSNEVGLGIVPDNELARKFRDLAGGLNRRVAALADEVYLIVAGIPLKIK